MVDKKQEVNGDNWVRLIILYLVSSSVVGGAYKKTKNLFFRVIKNVFEQKTLKSSNDRAVDFNQVTQVQIPTWIELEKDAHATYRLITETEGRLPPMNQATKLKLEDQKILFNIS